MSKETIEESVRLLEIFGNSCQLLLAFAGEIKIKAAKLNNSNEKNEKSELLRLEALAREHISVLQESFFVLQRATEKQIGSRELTLVK